MVQEQIGLGLHQRGFVAAVPGRACASVGMIDVVDGAPADRDDQT